MKSESEKKYSIKEAIEISYELMPKYLEDFNEKILSKYNEDFHDMFPYFGHKSCKSVMIFFIKRFVTIQLTSIFLKAGLDEESIKKTMDEITSIIMEVYREEEKIKINYD